MTIYFDTKLMRSLTNVTETERFGQTWISFHVSQSAGDSIEVLSDVDAFNKKVDAERYVLQ